MRDTPPFRRMGLVRTGDPSDPVRRFRLARLEDIAFGAPPATLVLTAELDPASASRVDALCRAHLSPDRNTVPAHLTLFHGLPAEGTAHDLQRLAWAPCAFAVTGLRRLGGGVAFEVRSPGLAALRDSLARHWSPVLGAHDRRPFNPRITVHSRVEPARAASLDASLGADFTPWTGSIGALLLWRYQGGPWSLAARRALVA